MEMRFAGRCLALVLLGCALHGLTAAQEVKVEKVADKLVFPEGPVWHPDGFLIFSDVHAATIQKLKPQGGSEPWLSQGKETNGLILSRDARKIYACCTSELALLEIDAHTKEARVLVKDYQGRPLNNVNDVAIDAQGHVFFTDPKWGAKPDDVQGVYCYSPRESTVTLAARLDQQPNGIVVSPDQKYLYVGRSGASDIWRFELGSDATLSSATQWARLEEGAVPDGMTVDRHGNLYVAQAGNGKLSVVSPEGKILQSIQVFNRIATNCEFEGENQSVLYVTGGGREGKLESTRQGGVCKVTFPDAAKGKAR